MQNENWLSFVNVFDEVLNLIYIYYHTHNFLYILGRVRICFKKVVSSVHYFLVLQQVRAVVSSFYPVATPATLSRVFLFHFEKILGVPVNTGQNSRFGLKKKKKS